MSRLPGNLVQRKKAAMTVMALASLILATTVTGYSSVQKRVGSRGINCNILYWYEKSIKSTGSTVETGITPSTVSGRMAGRGAERIIIPVWHGFPVLIKKGAPFSGYPF